MSGTQLPSYIGPPNLKCPPKDNYGGAAKERVI